MSEYKSKYKGQQIDDILGNAVQKSDLYKYATKAEVESSINSALGNIPTPDVSGQISEHNRDAGAHPYIQDKVAEVEDKIPTKVSDLSNDKGYLTEHQDISHLATKEELQEKQDIISDLENIREGAALGATALQEEQYKGTITSVELGEEVDEPELDYVTKGELSEVEEKVNSNRSNINGIQGVLNGTVDADITNTLIWTKGCWHFSTNQGPGTSFMQQIYRYARLDVSNYDSIKLSGLKDGGPMSISSNRYPTISIYGDNKPIKYVDVVDGDSYTLFTRDYMPYNKLEIIIMAYQSEETYVPSIKVSKNNVFDGVFVPKRIVLCGDSLMGNESSLITMQLNSIAKAQGYEIVRHTKGGENIIGNLTRNGGIGIRVTTDFVMPTSGSVDIEVESAWMKSDGTYAQNPYNSASNRDVRIMGIKGKLTRNSTTSYTFTRNEEGESFKVGIGTLLWDEALWSCKDYPHIWFTGQNSGYENEQDWADMINMAVRNFGENFIVCSTALARTTNQLVRCATKTFGDKYINLKAYTEGQAVYDGQRFGLIDSSALATDYGSLFWSDTDEVHQNNLLSYMWAVLMWNTLLDLGYVEGDRIVTGDYYKQ